MVSLVRLVSKLKILRLIVGLIFEVLGSTYRRLPPIKKKPPSSFQNQGVG